MDLKSSKVMLPRGTDLRSFPAPDSLRGRRLKGKGTGVLGARETRGARAPATQARPRILRFIAAWECK